MLLTKIIKRWMRATKGRFVTIDERPVFIGGPSQGGGGSSGGSASAMPQDLSKMTPEQRQVAMTHLTSLSLDELRRRQDLLPFQFDEANRRGNQQALTNLNIRQDLLGEAVDRVAFPEDYE